MDNFLLYGLLLLACVNMGVAALTFTVKFYTSSRVGISHVNQGDSVELWCFGGKIDVYKRVTWIRETNSNGMETIWSYEGGRLLSDTVLNEAASGYEEKFIMVQQRSYRIQHKIKLLNAQKEDEGKYWCVVDINGVNTTSPSPKLIVNVPETTSSTTTTITTITTTATPIVTIGNNSDTITTNTPIVTTANISDTITESSPLPQLTTPTYSLSSSQQATTPITTMPARDPTANEMYEAPDGNGELPTPLIGGAVGGSVVLMIIVVVIIVVIRRCKRNPNEDKETEMKENDYYNVGCEPENQNDDYCNLNHSNGIKDGKPKTPNSKRNSEDDTKVKDCEYSEIDLESTFKNHGEDPKPSQNKIPQNEMMEQPYSEIDSGLALPSDNYEVPVLPKATGTKTEGAYSNITNREALTTNSDVQYANVSDTGYMQLVPRE